MYAHGSMMHGWRSSMHARGSAMHDRISRISKAKPLTSGRGASPLRYCPETSVGTIDLPLVAFPSWPYSLSPQQ